MKQFGKVYLVGAGPGDPGLITLRGTECLQAADLVLYDYLVNPQILEHARCTAELVCLGRHGRERIMPQEQVNQRLVQAALEGRVVVRLKGGDPAIFARCSEEIAAIVQAGIPYEVVPGVTAAFAAGSYAGIPLTHRDLASGVALIAGQEKEGKPSSAIDYEALAHFPGTLVFYMGVTTAPEWTEALIRAGKPAATPVAVVRRCSWPDQQTFRCRLGDLAQLFSAQRVRPPVVVIVGEVAREELQTDCCWFDARPLRGQTVLVTRPADQARPIRNQLAQLGAQVLLQPAITISDPPDWAPVDAVIAALERFDWLVFSSSNGVDAFFNRLLGTGYDLRQLRHAKLATIGPATAEALSRYHLRADLQPDQFRAEALAEALAQDAAGKRFLLLRASRGREVLAEQLSAAGGLVEQVVVYSSLDVQTPAPEIIEALRSGRVTWTTVTSSAIARSLAHLFGDDLQHTKLVSISPLTSEVLRELGHEPALEAAEYTTDGIVSALLAQAGPQS